MHMYVYAYISFSLVPPWDLRVCQNKRQTRGKNRTKAQEPKLNRTLKTMKSCVYECVCVCL